MKALFLVLPSGPPERSNYQHSVVQLAEGMQAAGWEFYGTIPYWAPDGQPLLKAAPAGFSPDYIICDHTYALASEADPGGMQGSILIDLADGYRSLATDHTKGVFKRILRAHYHADIPYVPQVRPWFFGLTNRMRQGVDATYNQEPAQNKIILHNFRVEHELRDFALFMLAKRLQEQKSGWQLKARLSDNEAGTTLHGLDYQYWALSGRRHDPAFYQMLGQHPLSLAFGGYMWESPAVLAFPDWAKKLAKLWWLKLQKAPASFYTLYNYDSWRFWEVMYAASVPVHLDLAAWGCTLPVMPIAGQHYIGVQGYDFAKTVTQIDSLSQEQIRYISMAGRQFAQEHYGPEGALRHFLAAVQP